MIDLAAAKLPRGHHRPGAAGATDEGPAELLMLIISTRAWLDYAPDFRGKVDNLGQNAP
jgi:hypothetical protein